MSVSKGCYSAYLIDEETNEVNKLFTTENATPFEVLDDARRRLEGCWIKLVPPVSVHVQAAHLPPPNFLQARRDLLSEVKRLKQGEIAFAVASKAAQVIVETESKKFHKDDEVLITAPEETEAA